MPTTDPEDTMPDTDKHPAGDWTNEELADAEHDLQETLRGRLQYHLDRLERPLPTSHPGRHAPGYHRAMVYLTECVLYPRRVVLGLTPDSSEEWQAAVADMHDQLWTLPEQPGPDPRLRVQYRCPECRCGVESTHVPGSDDCKASRRERDTSRST